MNKTAIKNFAIWARRKLISDITYKASMLGITENGIAEPLSWSTQDLQFFDIGTKDYAEVSGMAIAQRNGLVHAILAKEAGSDYKTAFRSVIEEVAYTWFNRLIAVRFMEVNDYLPSRIRVLSSESAGKLEPDLVTTPFDTDLVFTDKDRDYVYELKDENKLDELFRFLFIKQCNALNEILPGLFEALLDYTELLLNITFTDKDGIVYHLTHDISEDEFNVEKEGQVEIIGWLYQYYNTEPKDEVFALLKKNVKITKERIPAATQLFTPDWIVRYMVENSLGRLWVEGHPNESLKGNWKYYLEEAEQEPDVIEQLKKIRDEYAKINPVDIKVIDPCMGSGHILVYAFDVLMQIYTSQGYVERDAAKSILQNNLFGIDIDVRAYQLAYFAVMMKARQYNRRIFSEEIRPNLIAIRNPRDISASVLKKLGGLEPVGLRLVEEFKDAEEYGSILQPNITVEELDRLELKLDELRDAALNGDLLDRSEVRDCLKLMKPLVKQGRLLCQKYDVVVTNPPYLGIKSIKEPLATFISKYYADTKFDVACSFVEHMRIMSHINGFFAAIVPQGMAFAPTFSGLRERIIRKTSIAVFAQLGLGVFGADRGTVSFVIRNSIINNYISNGLYLESAKESEEKAKLFVSAKNRSDETIIYKQKPKLFLKIPNIPIAFSCSRKMINMFLDLKLISEYGITRQGLATSDNDRFARLWYEVPVVNICFHAKDSNEAKESGMKWFPFNKGGGMRRWYGNLDYIVNWENDGKEMKEYATMLYKSYSRTIKNENYYFRPAITWSDVGNVFSGRQYPAGSIFSTVGLCMFAEDNDFYQIIGYLNSKITMKMLSALNPTIHFNVGDIALLPYKSTHDDRIDILVKNCIALSAADWDSYEESWDFKRHPLVFELNLKKEYYDSQWSEDRLSKCSSLSWLYQKWESECEHRFQRLKANEEELNRIFIDIYGLQDELTPDVADKDVTVRKADLGREIRSLISYAVGCMFGRYSLDVDGLAYAGGYWDPSKYQTFIPDSDNCIPITDEEYFQDDIVGRFVEFVRAAYGADYLEENLEFIAKALGNKGNTSREVIRNYFLNDFYKDHLKVYQKRPIYWLFDSGKQNGFKALVYMHRWNSDTVGNLRIEYLHKMQTVYEREIENCQDMIDHGSGRDVAVAVKRKEKLVKQLKECRDYDALVAHIAFSKVDIDLDDGVKVNYRKVQTGADGKFCEILAASKDIMAKEK